jgi:hypothetical protein
MLTGDEEEEEEDGGRRLKMDGNRDVLSRWASIMETPMFMMLMSVRSWNRFSGGEAGRAAAGGRGMEVEDDGSG